MYRFFVAPLEGLKATMEEIAEGDLNAYAEENSDVEEFRLMATTFNHMMDQIQKLKIDAYEQERRIQNATIQYLQIQIRPTFLLNCLKNFYALAEQKEYHSIQELTLALSSYLRKVITYEEDTISVRKEMESVESYLKLSQLGLSVPVNYNIAVDEKLEEFQILPLSVLTFVENAVKYGVQSQKITAHQYSGIVTPWRDAGGYLCVYYDSGQRSRFSGRCTAFSEQGRIRRREDRWGSVSRMSGNVLKYVMRKKQHII